MGKAPSVPLAQCVASRPRPVKRPPSAAQQASAQVPPPFAPRALCASQLVAPVSQLAPVMASRRSAGLQHPLLRAPPAGRQPGLVKPSLCVMAQASSVLLAASSPRGALAEQLQAHALRRLCALAPQLHVPLPPPSSSPMAQCVARPRVPASWRLCAVGLPLSALAAGRCARRGLCALQRLVPVACQPCAQALPPPALPLA